MNPTRIPKKSHLLHWTKQGHETYTEGERVQVYRIHKQECLLIWLIIKYLQTIRIRTVNYEGSSESKERLRIQHTQLFHCTR